MLKTPKVILESLRSFLMGRKAAYCSVFEGPQGEEVLRDLAKFCRAGQTVFDPDPRVTALLQGRQEVYLRIQQHLNLPVNRLYDLYGGPKEDD